MDQTDLKLSSIRKIDTHRRGLPFVTIVILLILITAIIWFLRGGSFRFYTSLFFGLYFLTNQAWISIVLVGIIQSFIFLPLRIINHKYQLDMKAFEDEVEKTKTDNQSFLFHKKIQEGSIAVLFYIFNFVLLTMAFFSVGRVFLLDFYNEKIDPKYLYNFIHYPHYPINGTIFHFPFLHITKTIALNWSTIIIFWLYVLAFFVILRFLWVLIRAFLKKNKKFLKLRIGYNRLLVFISGFLGTLIIASFFFLRHIPVSAHFTWLSADLALQNTGFNIITAICTFIAAFHLGHSHNKLAAQEAKLKGIPDNIVSKVFKNKMKITIRNSIFLCLLTYWLTHMFPCSHDLSVLSFEAIYFLSPFTFDKLVKKTVKPIPSTL